MEQLSEEWFEDRLGRITASRVARILSGGHQQWYKIMDDMQKDIDLGAEYLMNNQIDAKPLRWGRENEEPAIRAFEMLYDVDVERVGSIHHPELDYVSASPDGRIKCDWMDGIAEVKSPWNPENHILTLNHGMPSKHKPQVQLQMAVTETDSAVFLSYDPRHKDIKKRLYVEFMHRDDIYIENMLRKCEDFYEIFNKGNWRGNEPEGIPELF